MNNNNNNKQEKLIKQYLPTSRKQGQQNNIMQFTKLVQGKKYKFLEGKDKGHKNSPAPNHALILKKMLVVCLSMET